MADIELVIKIPEEEYKKVLDTNNRECDWNNMHSCYEAILNGVPLPKGHGRLKDVDKLLKEARIDIWTDYGFESKISPIDVESAPTIIEADKEQTDGNDD